MKKILLNFFYSLRGWGGDTQIRRGQGWDSIFHPRWYG